ncbi:MAG TPA: helix-turn-helix transcriptional regulator [Clostridia bacterium]|nr:helix-turn-helix transcriptional regulator [Clostridia bacterium]
MEMVKRIVSKSPQNAFYSRTLVLCIKYESGLPGNPYLAAALSMREIDILALTAQGLSRKEMAARLYISEETVKTHFKNIYQSSA